MKYLLVLLVVVIAISIWRGKRRTPPSPRHQTSTSGIKRPEGMTACAYCGVHLPVTEAISGPSGQNFCSTEHRLLAQQSTPHT